LARPRYNTVSDIALEQVRNYILSGKLKPGQKINQGQLTEELGFSLIPLREAFKRLQAEGYIDIIPHRGAYVKGLSQEEVEDLYMIRVELEEMAAGLAADKLSAKDIETVRNLYQQMVKATAERNSGQLLALNRRFHFTIYRASGRKYLLEILDYLWDRSERYRNLQASDPAMEEEELLEHKEILQACENRDRRRLMKAIRFNVDQSRRNLQKIRFDEADSRG
jgi:DNA-binding GntR family transcriptional regulator